MNITDVLIWIMQFVCVVGIFVPLMGSVIYFIVWVIRRIIDEVSWSEYR